MRDKYVDVKIVLFMIALFLLLQSKFAIVKVNGNSMSPTYEDGDIIVLKLKRQYEHDDLIVFEAPDSWSTDGQKSYFLKRIAAVSGDRLDSSSDGLLVNGRLVRKHTGECSLSDSSEVLLPYRKLLVLGDNKVTSNDSYRQMCEGNDEILIDENSIIHIGNELFKIGGWR